MLIDTLNKKITQFIEDGISKLDVKDEEVLELVNTDFLYTLNTPDIHLATNNFWLAMMITSYLTKEKAFGKFKKKPYKKLKSTDGRWQWNVAKWKK